MTSLSKKNIYDACIQLINKRVAMLKEAIAHAQEAANDDTKSSAGDKYETGRAMMFLEQEKTHAQLKDALEQQRVFSQIRPSQQHATVQLGSLVATNSGIFFLGASIGKVMTEGTPVFVISPASPMGKALMGKPAGQTVEVNGRPITIHQVA